MGIFEDIVMSALYGTGASSQESGAAYLLLTLVQRSITCPHCGRMMDISEAVLVEIESDQHGPSAHVVCGECGDGLDAQAIAYRAGKGSVVTIARGALWDWEAQRPREGFLSVTYGVPREQLDLDL